MGSSLSLSTAALLLAGSAVALLCSNLVISSTRFLLTARKYRHIPRRHSSLLAAMLLYDSNGGMERIVQEMYDPAAGHYGDIIYQGVAFGGCHMVALTNPEDYKVVLGDLETFRKDETYEYIEAFLGNGLVVSTGPTWKLHRRVLTPAFHFQFLRDLFPLMAARTAKTMAELHRLQGLEQRDVYEVFSQLTLDVIIEASVGPDAISLDHMGTLFKEAVASFTPFFLGGLLLGKRTLSYLPFRFARGLPDKREELQRLIRVAVEKRRQDSLQSAEELKGKKDFVSLMLASGELSDPEILDEGVTFFFAAHDTTSSMLSWAMYFLAKYPEYQQKIQQQLDENGFVLDELTPERLEDFPLLKMFINETLRYRPPVVSLTRELMEDREFRGYHVPKGTILHMVFQATHLDPRYWEDPDRFYPERFAKDEAHDDRHPYAFLPFSAGPRSCIGKRFAMQESQVILGAMLSNFTIEGNTEGVMADTRSISRPTNFKARFVPRNK